MSISVIPKIQDSIAFHLPELHLTRDALTELYSFLQYLQFKHKIDLETAIDSVEEELDVLVCQDAEQSDEPTYAWSDVKREAGLI